MVSDDNQINDNKLPAKLSSQRSYSCDKETN